MFFLLSVSIFSFCVFLLGFSLGKALRRLVNVGWNSVTKIWGQISYGNTALLLAPDLQSLQIPQIFLCVCMYSTRVCWIFLCVCVCVCVCMYLSRVCWIFLCVCMCGDLRINNKTPNRMLTCRLPHTTCINASPRIRFHASIRLKIRKKRKIIKSKVANGKRSRQN